MAEARADAAFRKLAEEMEQAAQTLVTREGLAGIGGMVERSIRDRMDRAVTPEGKPHKPLSEEWIRFKKYGTTSEKKALGVAAKQQKRRERAEAAGRSYKHRGPGGYSERIWQYTGASKDRTRVTRITRSSVTVVINTPYSAYADEDRPVVGWSDADQREAEKILADAAAREIEQGIHG